MRPYRILLRTLSCSALILICVWPAIYNGQPLFFVDTPAYIRTADAGLSRLFHHRTVWTNEEIAVSGNAVEGRYAAQGDRKSMSSIADQTVLAGRSVYYGGLLYCGQLFCKFWPSVLAQAGAVLLAISLTLHTLGRFTWMHLGTICLVLATMTPMAFFVSYLMPDIFAGITILAIANLLIGGSRMPSWAMAIWLVLLSSALLFHISHVLITIAMLAIGISTSLLSPVEIHWKPVGAIFAVLIIAFAGETIFNVATTKLVGTPPIRPPFLMARMIADGPGYRYLLANCPVRALAVCQFVPRSTVLTSDQLLWDVDPARGIFAAAAPKTRRRIASEQYRFAVATLAFDPLGVLVAWMRDMLRQVTMFSLEEFRFDDGAKGFLSIHVPEPYLSPLQHTRIWKGVMPIRTISKLTILSTVVSVLFIIGCLIVGKKVVARETGLFFFSFIVVAGTIINAMVCGIVSTPHDRYEARVIWLLPLLAMLIGGHLYQSVSKRAEVAEQHGIIHSPTENKQGTPSASSVSDLAIKVRTFLAAQSRHCRLRKSGI